MILTFIKLRSINPAFCGKSTNTSMTTNPSAAANINALKGCLVIIGDSFHLCSGDPSGETMRCPFQHDKTSVLLCPSCWLSYTLFSMQHLLIELMDFPACQPPLLQLFISMLDSGISYLSHHVRSYTTPPPLL